MSIRKHKGKIALSIAAVFWAACDNDSSSSSLKYIEGTSCEDDEQAMICQSIALYGVPSYDMSSAEVSGDCDEASGCAESSSSEASATESSSSEALAPASSSVNSEYPYSLKNKPSVICKDSTISERTHYCPSSKAPIASAEENSLLSETIYPVYGVSTPVCNESYVETKIFSCNNGKRYRCTEFTEKDGVIYQYGISDKGEYLPIEEINAMKIAKAEADTTFPYALESDTTVKCKTKLKIVDDLCTDETDPYCVDQSYTTTSGFSCNNGETLDSNEYVATDGKIHKKQE